VKRADWMQILKYTVWNVAHSYGKTATFMPSPSSETWLGHARAPVGMEGRPEPLHRNGYSGLSDFALFYIGGIIKHAKALNAITNPVPIRTSAGARLRGADQPRVLGAQSISGLPDSARHQSKRAEWKCGSPIHDERVPCFCGHADGGLDGVQNKVHPGDPIDKNLYDLPPAQAKKVQNVCSSLDMAIDHLNKDREFLTKGAYSPTTCSMPIALKMKRSHASHDDASGRVRHVLQLVGRRGSGRSEPAFDST